MSSSKTTKYLLVVGARPNFMKIAPIHRAFSSRRNGQSTADLLLVHTGQHYSRNMLCSGTAPENLRLGDHEQQAQTDTQSWLAPMSVSCIRSTRLLGGEYIAR